MLPGVIALLFHAVNLRFVSMELIKAHLIHNKEINENTEGDANAQTKGVDEGIHLALNNITCGDFQVVMDHTMWFLVNL
jgi:hypothetical protein